MPEANDEGKAYRVACWLDDLLECARGLDKVRQKIEELELDHDGIGCRDYRREKVAGTSLKADRIGDIVAEREERLAALSADAKLLEEAVRGGERTIREAWKASDGSLNPCFDYVVRRYAKGEPQRDAAMAAGLGRYEAMLAPRKVGPSIYDSAPGLFSKPMAEGYGFWEFVLGEVK